MTWVGETSWFSWLQRTGRNTPRFGNHWHLASWSSPIDWTVQTQQTNSLDVFLKCIHLVIPKYTFLKFMLWNAICPCLNDLRPWLGGKNGHFPIVIRFFKWPFAERSERRSRLFFDAQWAVRASWRHFWSQRLDPWFVGPPRQELLKTSQKIEAESETTGCFFSRKKLIGGFEPYSLIFHPFKPFWQPHFFSTGLKPTTRWEIFPQVCPPPGACWLEAALVSSAAREVRLLGGFFVETLVTPTVTRCWVKKRKD